MTVPTPDVRAVLAGRPALLEDACRRALAYLSGLAEQRVAPADGAVAAVGRLDFALPGPGLDATEVLAMLDEFGSPATVASAGPRYFGFVTGGALPVAQAAAWLAVAWDQNAALTVMSPAAARLNAVALRWVGELLGLPAGTAGGGSPGVTPQDAGNGCRPGCVSASAGAYELPARSWLHEVGRRAAAGGLGGRGGA